jgi:Ni/Fe-hydrogenase subunit HybB-like protein
MKVPFWRLVTVVIFGAGLYATWSRFGQGLAVSTNLSDRVPWGLWVGFNTLCGVGLSAGGFAIAAAVYILGLDRYRPVLRGAILISFLGYLTVVAGMMYELGLPWRIWHPIVFWNRSSVLFEVAWCVMCYTTVLTLEFSPTLAERVLWPKARVMFEAWHHRFLIGLVLIGVLLSSMHQSFLGGLYLMTKDKLYPLWFSASLPSLFFLSAIPSGLALTVMALFLCVRSLHVRIDMSILEEMGRLILIMLSLFGLARIVDLVAQGNFRYLFVMRPETGWFWMEFGLLVIAPVALLSRPEIRFNPLRLYFTCALVVAGFMAYRLNVAITGLQASSGTYYFPKWTEFAATFFTVTAGVVAFREAVLRLNVFPRAHVPVDDTDLPMLLNPIAANLVNVRGA